MPWSPGQAAVLSQVAGYKWDTSATKEGSPCPPQEDERAWSSPPRSGSSTPPSSAFTGDRQTREDTALRSSVPGAGARPGLTQLVSSHDSTSPRHGFEEWSSVAPPLAGRQRLCIRILRLSLLAEERMRAPTPCCAFPFPPLLLLLRLPSFSL
ncbi:hypothetical protein SETIT_7G286400v2 [Setaria italica]|uniref:Uncharacterized protein n=1 Tax=Setaria italica TaxID=4555 RepID=A0A368S111_SETIT|nr:hypothetical protein SETIT_7G286400v2 [Setaria italica]